MVLMTSCVLREEAKSRADRQEHHEQTTGTDRWMNGWAALPSTGQIQTMNT
jgi:hypothetical protein